MCSLSCVLQVRCLLAANPSVGCGCALVSVWPAMHTILFTQNFHHATPSLVRIARDLRYGRLSQETVAALQALAPPHRAAAAAAHRSLEPVLMVASRSREGEGMSADEVNQAAVTRLDGEVVVLVATGMRSATQRDGERGRQGKLSYDELAAVVSHHLVQPRLDVKVRAPSQHGAPSTTAL